MSNIDVEWQKNQGVCILSLSLLKTVIWFFFFIKEMDRQNKAVYAWLTDDTFHTEMYFVSVTRLEGY